MRNRYYLIPVFLITCLMSQAQTMDLEAYNPESTLVVPENPVSRAKFPFIDIHSHHFRMPEMDLSTLVRPMDEMNMAVMVNLSGRSGDNLKQAMENVKANYPNRFVVFANVDFSGVGEPGWGEQAAAQLAADVENGASGLKIYKSLGLRNVDVNGNRIAVDDPRLDPIWAMCATLNIPVLIHSADPKSFWDPMDANNERWLELKLRPRRKRSDTDPAPWQQIIDEQHRMFKKHPNTRFINAHMGWYANDLDKLATFLDDMPNMYVGIGAIIAELGRQPKQARAFFIRYQDRILFGKDAWNPDEYPTYFRVLETADEYFPYYKKYHAFWAMYGLDLPDEVLRKVYYANALKLLPNVDRSLFPTD
ncbi:Predicted metal-dependent hydrolase, TIM-barrel fold [Robiginitalea myxolifaciens]|uniref:Predicted metal-dependent hydrolase, TIM-barrel fold n=1 Tax=Robiginitalea myxolifaciens TaxID=400055 RepID=A0A1I6GY34_9FLAO|nr:amidohydrolase family protein [Robiginitalea myxolifaciens]SFR47060.1 Predicted metal-dependent hydrolase, TIM-barrel fold [Robiginitalea myxolifaciens]